MISSSLRQSDRCPRHAPVCITLHGDVGERLDETDMTIGPPADGPTGTHERVVDGRKARVRAHRVEERGRYDLRAPQA